MKSFSAIIELFKNYIKEKLTIKKRKHNYFPKTKEELQDIIKKRIEKEGFEVDLNDIDVSNITDMSWLFLYLNFNCDISNWDVSKVIHTGFMFERCAIDEKYKPKFK